jgi:entericidin B
MRKNLSIALTLLMLVGAAPLLGACQTTAGAGQDISAGGKAITNSAEKHLHRRWGSQATLSPRRPKEPWRMSIVERVTEDA